MRLVIGLRELPKGRQLRKKPGPWDVYMSDNSAATVFHSNRYTAQSACEHCQGIIRHERWCITVHRAVYYAYEIVADPSKLAIGDAIILHSLGAAWGENRCPAQCGPN